MGGERSECAKVEKLADVSGKDSPEAERGCRRPEFLELNQISDIRPRADSRPSERITLLIPSRANAIAESNAVDIRDRWQPADRTAPGRGQPRESQG